MTDEKNRDTADATAACPKCGALPKETDRVGGAGLHCADQSGAGRSAREGGGATNRLSLARRGGARNAHERTGHVKTKTCIDCQKSLAVDSFYRVHKDSEHRQSRCKPCDNRKRTGSYRSVVKQCSHANAAPLGRLLTIRSEDTIVMRCPRCGVRWRERPQTLQAPSPAVGNASKGDE